MKQKKLVLGISGAILFAVTGMAQEFSIDSDAIGYGGGVSSGGAFALTGTIGQVDAGAKMTGGQFAIESGFWNTITVLPTVGGPALTIQRRRIAVLISWTSSASGWTLQQNSQLSGTGWTPFSGSISDNGTTKTATYPSSTRVEFFRLFHP